MQTNNKSKPKYTSLLTPQELGFLEYYMIPQGNEFEYIYRPGDDSFLMLSVLKKQLDSFGSNPTICEVGTGSGILSVHLGKWLKDNNNPPLLHMGTDISIDACLFSTKYYEHYNIQVHQICTSLLKSLTLKPEIIICNPPYIPTDPSEKQNQLKYLQQKITSVVTKQDIKRSMDRNLIAFSYMGGPEGLDTTRALLQSISWNCSLYFIVMGEDGVQILEQEIQGGTIFCEGIRATMEVLQFYRKANEELYVILVKTSLK